MEFYRTPPTAGTVQQMIRTLKKRYPFLHSFTAGKSVQGRKLTVLTLGNLHDVNLMVGGVHAQEWITTLLLFRLIEALCQAIEKERLFCQINVSQTLLRRGLLVLPLLNPDGMEIAMGRAEPVREYRGEPLEQCRRRWNANAHGVDLNHNFDAGFALCRAAERQAGIRSPGPRQFGGLYPESEPETRALVHLCRGFSVHSAYAFHAQGEEIYYRYGNNTPEISYYMAELLAHLSGYRAADPTGLASHAGFKDWFLEAFGRPAFTIEVGRGENPLPLEDLDGIWEGLKEALATMTLL